MTLENRVARRFAPFALVALVVPLTAAVPPRPDRPLVFVAAVAATIAIVATGLLMPWSHLPRWTFLVPPLAYLPVIVLFELSHEDAESGYAVLAIPAVVWVALNLDRVAVTAAVLAGAIVLAYPLHSGAMGHDVRRLMLLLAVSAVVGFAVNTLVVAKRRSAASAREQAARAARSEAVLTTVAAVARELAGADDVRRQIAVAARDIADAAVGLLAEPGRDGMTVTAASLDDLVGRRLPGGCDAATLDTRGATSLEISVVSCQDRVCYEECTLPDLGALVSVPVTLKGVQIGVVAVGWPDAVSEVTPMVGRALELLADEAAIAIDRAELLADLERQAQTDTLTDLPNRRAWDEHLQRAVSLVSRSRGELYVAIIDLDRFKSYNDRYGHQAGDTLLQECADAWKSAIRTGDFLARYGGEEFGLLVPGCDEQHALQVVARLIRATPLAQTVSVGVAGVLEGDDAESLVARADEALYTAKKGGRNRVVVDRARHVRAA